MRYLLLIHADEKGPALPPEEQAAVMDRWFKYSDDQSPDLRAGVLLVCC